MDWTQAEKFVFCIELCINLGYIPVENLLILEQLNTSFHRLRFHYSRYSREKLSLNGTKLPNNIDQKQLLLKLLKWEKCNVIDEEMFMSMELNDILVDFIRKKYNVPFDDSKELDLQYNELQSIPISIGCTKASKLILSFNHLATIPASIGCTHLKVLDLSFNQLSMLPKSLCILPLETLLLNKNRLTKLPSNMKSLVHLKVLYLDFNYLSYLPELPRGLLDLKAHHNRIDSLHPSIWKLNLKKLSLYQNKLERIDDPHEMKSLEWFAADEIVF